jgi:lipopolysaccharide export LptBFGC system permease protein LptF
MTAATRGIRGVLRRWCGARTMERLVDPILADIELERDQSRRSGHVWRARWIVVSGSIGLAAALVLHGARGCVRALTADESAARTIWYTVAAFASLTLLLMLPPLVRDWEASRGWSLSERALLGLYLVPQAMPLSVPVALSLGILCSWPTGATVRSMGRRILVVTLAGTLLSLASMEWFIPEANQAWRVLVFRQIAAANHADPSPVLTRGINERSLSELAALTRAVSRPAASPEHDPILRTIEEISAAQAVRLDANRLRFMFHQRVALCFAPGVLAVLAIGAANAVRRRARARVLFVALAILYVAAWINPAAPASGYRPSAAAAAWLPHAAATAVSLLLVALGSVRSRTISAPS